LKEGLSCVKEVQQIEMNGRYIHIKPTNTLKTSNKPDLSQNIPISGPEWKLKNKEFTE